MSTTTAVPPIPVTLPTLAHHRFSVADYVRMSEAGCLSETVRTELLDGWVVDKMTTNPPHAEMVMALTEWFIRFTPGDWKVRCQMPITLAASVPEPDLVLVHKRSEGYRDRHPLPQEVALIIEVADTSLSVDRDVKRVLYAQARLPIYWIVNLIDARVEVYTQPRGGRSPTYRQRTDFTRGMTVPLPLDGVAVPGIAVDDLFPA